MFGKDQLETCKASLSRPCTLLNESDAAIEVGDNQGGLLGSTGRTEPNYLSVKAFTTPPRDLKA